MPPVATSDDLTAALDLALKFELVQTLVDELSTSLEPSWTSFFVKKPVLFSGCVLRVRVGVASRSVHEVVSSSERSDINTCREEYQIVIVYSEVMKTLEVVSKMAFLVFKKRKFPRIFCKIPANAQFCEIILKIYLTKRKNAFEKLNYISFLTWAITENPKFRVFVIFLASKKIEHLNFVC